MSKNPKISVVMGVYNAKSRDYIETAIKSILCQTYSDFEFIIFDDGSTNNSYDVLQEFANLDCRIKLFSNPKNLGLATTLNNCLSVAVGKYIARMDVDDYCYPERLEKQIKFISNNEKYDIVTSWAGYFDDNISHLRGTRKVPEYPSKKDMLFNSPFLHGGAMYTKKMIDELEGYRVSKETLRMEDYDLWMRAYSKNYLGYNIQENLYLIREDQDALSRRKYKYRLDEARVRYMGFKKLGILFPVGIFYVIKPVVVGLIPKTILIAIKKKIE